MRAWRVELRIDSRLDHVAPLGRAVRALGAAAGLEPRIAAQVELALVEAANNCIRHAYHHAAGHPVEIACTLADDEFSIEVTDTGSAMPARPAPVFEFDPGDLAHLPEGGMGLYLIHQVMDRVEYASRAGRNTLVMTRRLGNVGA